MAAAAVRPNVPLVANELRAICGHCEKTAQKLDACGRCKVEKYCSADHQKAAWKKHKQVCREHPKHLHLSHLFEHVQTAKVGNEQKLFLLEFLMTTVKPVVGKTPYIKVSHKEGVLKGVTIGYAEEITEENLSRMSEGVKTALQDVRSQAFELRDRDQAVGLREKRLYLLSAQSEEGENAADYVATKVTIMLAESLPISVRTGSKADLLHPKEGQAQTRMDMFLQGIKQTFAGIDINFSEELIRQTLQKEISNAVALGDTPEQGYYMALISLVNANSAHKEAQKKEV